MSDGVEEALAGIGDAAIRPRLAAFARLVLRRNASLNLTAARDPAALAAHIVDSLELAPHLREPLVDIGSGGGFPAVPLAIATGCRVTLIESTAKKARFLEAVVQEFGLPVQVVCERAEIAGHDPSLRGTFASATARAVASAPTVLELTVPLLALGGVALLQRGVFDEPERSATSDAASMLGAELSEEILLEGVRRILIVTKRAPTPVRFPRRPGIPAKRPLCLPGRPGASVPS